MKSKNKNKRKKNKSRQYKNKKNIKYKNKRKTHFLIGIIFLIVLVALMYLSYDKIIYFLRKITNYSYNTQINITEIIDEYLLPIPKKFNNDKKEEKYKLNKFLRLEILQKNKNDSIVLEGKIELLKIFSKFTKVKNFTKLDTIYLTKAVSFGNTIIMINNFIYYCEIIGCRNIYLNPNHNWFIKNNITTDKINIAFVKQTEINFNDSAILCVSLWTGFCLNPIKIKPEIRIYILKNEIFQNLPYIEIDQSALYIHIRSGDIFKNYINKHYSQPPLCFYQKILKNFKFKKIYIVAINDNNPVINHLLKEFPNIIYNKNYLSIDLALLMKAYNLVGSVSSMVLTSIIFNTNLKNYWEYDIFQKSVKFTFLHFDEYEYKRKFKIYKMKPSENYKNEMFSWYKTQNQLDLMIQEKCENNFVIINPNI